MKEHDQYALRPEQIPQIVEFVHSCQQRDGIRVVAGDNLGYYEVPSIREKPWKGCFAGRHVLGIDADGTVKGCLSLRREAFSEGNIREEPLRKIWEDPQRFKFNRYFSPDMLTGHCTNCPHAIPCRAGCVVTSHGATGNRFDNPYCAFRIQSGKGSCGWAEDHAAS